MPSSLLQVKLYKPPARSTWVRRPRLIRRLEEGRERKLTLLSAPAGFGKTTLLSAWAAESDAQIAWLSLDEDDNDPNRFWSYVVAALQTLCPSVGDTTLSRLRSSQPLDPAGLLGDLINEIAASDDRMTLLLDDYHLIREKPIHEAVIYLTERLPRQLRLVMASRADPPLPLHLLRARRELLELRAADLRFNAGEASRFLNDAMGLDLSPELVDALERRTEGGITGLQLAALSMTGRDDVRGFVRAFAGSHRYVLDYLAEEVLRQQPPAVQRFLLRTSVLSRMTASLCDAVTGRFDGFETLRALERGNLFVVPLDDERRWYRYHHLFAEVLRAFLRRQEGKDVVDDLHRRASCWYEDHGEPDQAFGHAAAGQDYERAARLIEENWLRVGHSGRIKTILHWLEMMPDDVVRERPLLSLVYAWALWLTGRVAASEPHLDAAAAGWDREEAAGIVNPDRRRWRAGGTALRIQLVRHRGDLEAAMRFARETLRLAPRDDPLVRGYGHLGLAHAHRELGEYEAALDAYARGKACMRLAGNASSACLTAFYQCRLLHLLGRPREAAEVVRDAMTWMDGHAAEDAPAYGILYVARGTLLCEAHELSAAEEHLERGWTLSRRGGHHDYVRNAAIALTRLKLAERDGAGALRVVLQAESATAAEEMPLPSAETAAHKARAWLVTGNLADAARWAENAGRRAGQDHGYTRQVEAASRARVFLAQGDPGAVLDNVARCERMAARSGARGWAVEVAIIGALACEAQGDRLKALAYLDEALSSADPGAYAQLFVDEGRAMAVLLNALLSEEYQGHQDSSCEGRDAARQLLDILVDSVSLDERGGEGEFAALIEPLTPREEEVLRLMATGLSNREIAQELIIALGTVKAHLHHIYGKLGVGGRTAAAARARELGLL